MKAAMGQRYAHLHRPAAPAGRTVLLHIGNDATGVAAGTGAEPDAVLVLQLGAKRTATDFFKHQPPSPLEIETAIMAVEDEVMRARAAVLGGPTLYATDDRVADMAVLLGSPAALTLEQVERPFNQLAARAEGRPASQLDIPDTPEFAATLLILREFMHHLGFEAVQVVRQPAPI
ncbi:MAG: hypothetical protein ACKVOT_02440 [Polaromonas sp.]